MLVVEKDDTVMLVMGWPEDILFHPGPPPEKLRSEMPSLWAPHMGNTLHDNRDGELLLSLLSEPDFASFVTGTVEDPQRVTDPAKRTCWAALTCANLMCRFGGVSNPVCVACGGVAAACIITEIACWFTGCDCCF